MKVFKRATDLSLFLLQSKQNEKQIGFVPTMGALHQGHLSLLDMAREETALTVCSIFVNPTQFNNPDDFSKYPVTIEEDIEKLAGAGCDCLLLPSIDEIYPANYKAPFYDLGPLETILEGQYRPGHFQGVCQVVDRLLQVVQPNKLYLGQKDFQQCKVIQQLLSITPHKDVSIVIAPTIREEDGLAMSSRNLRLTSEQRKKAPAIFRALQKAKAEIASASPEEISAEATRQLSEQGFRVDYFAIRDAATLLSQENTNDPKVALVAAYLDDIRLIDNLLLN